MASFNVWFGGFLVLGLLVFGAVQTVLDHGAAGAGMATASPSVEPQRDLNLCMNECMRGCVTDLSQEDKCRGRCDQECKA